MKTLIRSVDIITLDDQDRVLGDAAIAVADGRIVSVGEPPPHFEPDETVDAAGHVALPGFFNAHTHAAMTLQRGWAEDLPLDRWFNERIWVAESALQEEDVYWGSALAACEMIHGGTVAFADHYFWMNRVAQVVAESGMKALLAWCVFGLGAEQEIGGTTLDRTIGFVQEWGGAAGGRIRTVLGPHSPYVCSPEFLAQVALASARIGAGVHLHVAESRGQMEESLKRHGKTPVAHAAGLGLLELPSIAAHCLHLGAGDAEILAKHDVTVAHCPKTYMKLSMGVAPVLEMLSNSVHVAVGTDGCASGNSLSMLESLRLTSLVQKLCQDAPESLPGLAPLRLATQAGARALGFPESGVLAPDRPADLILVDCRSPHMRPRHDLAANLTYSAEDADVRYVMVGGRWLMAKGVLLTLDAERICHEAERRALRMVRSPLSRVRAYQA